MSLLSKLKPYFLFMFASLALASCGDTDFRGGIDKIEEGLGKSEDDAGETDENNNDDLEKGVVGPSDGNLFWLWTCPTEANGGPADNAEKSTIYNEGPHRVALTDGGVDVNVSSLLCEPSEVMRDIVFVIDISGSMDGSSGPEANDPIINGNCGRRDAVEAVINSFKNPDLIHVGLVTFDKSAAETVETMPIEDFKAEYLTAEVLCEGRNRHNGTNYQAALEPVADLFSGDRSNALREVYFVSDGFPRSATDGAAEAKELRDDGVVIATLMLTGDDSVLINYIASETSGGEPLHAKTTEADKLAERLKSLSRTDIAEGFVEYRSPKHEESEHHEMDIDIGETQSISLKITNANKVTFPEGIELKFNYTDTRGGTYERSGILNWE